MLDEAMGLLVRVQLGNGNNAVREGLDVLTDDLDEIIQKQYKDILD